MTFTNLFPSTVDARRTALFVCERMRRVAGASSATATWSVVAPVPAVVWPLRRGDYRRWARVPIAETWQGVDVRHPRFRHWPGISQRRQADAVQRGARAVVGQLCERATVVLDAHYLWPDGVAAAGLAAELGVPFTLTARGSDVNVLGRDPYVRERIAAAAARAHACMAVSDALGERFAEIAGLPREGVTTVRNGVDLERFAPGDAREARRALGLPVDGRLVLGVGRLVAGKGFALAARCMAELGEAMLVLVGDGPERAAIAAAGGERVRFLGTQPPDRTALAYRAADVLVLPSEREGWPNVVTEALASGLPVVASRVGGIPQILGDDPEPWLGALVDAGDRAGFVAALGRVLEVGNERARVRAFAERYGWREPVEHLVATFARAFAGGAT